MSKKFNILPLALVVSGTLSGQALAQDELTESWSGSASLGGVISSGNTDTTSISGAINVARQKGVWKHNAFGSIFTAESEGEDTADRYEIGYQLDRQFNETTYGFGRLRYDHDSFGGIDSRFTGLIGAGRQFIKSDVANFSAEIGVGGTSTELVPSLAADGTPTVAELDFSSAVIYLGANYDRKITGTTIFVSSLNIEVADDNTYSIWDNSLNIKVSDNLALGLGLSYRNNSDFVGIGGKKSDTVTTVNIIYGI